MQHQSYVRFWIYFSKFLCLLLLIGCSQEKESLIIGKWMVLPDKSGFVMVLGGMPETIRFEKDGTVFTAGLIGSSGTYKFVKNSYIQIEISGRNRMYEVVKLAKNKLILKNEYNQLTEYVKKNERKD